MGDIKFGDLAVRIDAVGHASPRWRGAKNAAEAAQLNQQLSELRAQNVRRAIEEIIKRELPSLPIAVPSKGVGSQDRFPTASEDNAAIDRSVVVTVELTTTQSSYKAQYPAHRRMYVPSKVWTLRVHTMLRGAALGYVEILLKVGLINPYSGKEIMLSGWLHGGGSAMSVKESFKMSPSNALKDARNLWQGHVGRDVVFQTPEAMDFDDWSHGGPGRAEYNGLMARLGKVEASFGLKTKLAYLVFPDLGTKPDMLIFDYKALGFGGIKADAFLVYGNLYMEGPNPGDYLELPNYPDIIPTQHTNHNIDGLVLSFPTGKSGLLDLTQKDRQRLNEFVTNKARAIGALAETFNTSGRP